MGGGWFFRQFTEMPQAKVAQLTAGDGFSRGDGKRRLIVTLPRQLDGAQIIVGKTSWHPLPTLIWYLAPAVGLMVSHSNGASALLWLVIGGNLLGTRPDRLWLGTRVLPALLSIAFFAIWLPWTVPGQPAWPDWGWSPSWEGLNKGLGLFLKGTGVAMAFLALGRRLSLQELLSTLQTLGFPSLFLTLVWITVQQTERLIREWKSLSQAHRSRGAFLTENPNRMRLMARSWAQLLIRVTKRSEDLHDALKARAFQRRFLSIETHPHDFSAWLGALAKVALVGSVLVFCRSIS